MVYRLGKRAISQFIRSDCQRRLRLDLYRSERDREAVGAPKRDTHRPGLALLTQAGRSHERRKFGELAEVLPGLVMHGESRAFAEGEERAFGTLSLADRLGGVIPNQILIEAEYEVEAPFRAAHGLDDLYGGAFFGGTDRLEFAKVRPDIIHVVPPDGTPRRAMLVDGRLESVDDQRRLGLKIVDIKISGEASPAHFAELAYYGMTLAGWLTEHGYDDRFFVLAEAAVWPGRHDASSIERQLQADVAEHILERRPALYLAAFAQDLEQMPPEVVLGRVSRFLQNELRAVLSVPDWRDLSWHVDRRCLGCDYLGYRWSTDEDAAAGIATPPARSERENMAYCWTMARDVGHPSQIAGLTEGATGKLLERGIASVAEVAGVQPGNPVFETHQTLRAKRTVLVARGVSLTERRPAEIPDRAGTSAVLPRFSDIRVFLSADFDVATGITFALGSFISYGIPNAPRDPAANRGYGRDFRERRRPMLVLDRSVEEEGRILREWLGFLVQDIMRARAELLAGYRQYDPDKDDVSIQFYVWDRLIFDHLCRVMGRHLDLMLQPVDAGGANVSPVSWLFPADSVLEDARFTAVSSPITVVSEIVNSLMAAAVPHHYGLVSLANAIDPERRVRDGRPWHFNVNKFYLDPLSDQIPSERGTEIWERKSPFRTQDFQWHQEQTRRVVIDKLRAVAWTVQGLQRRLSDTLSADAPNVDDVFRPVQALTGVGVDGQMIYQHARLMHAADRLENDLLMAMPPHEREARFESARVQRTLTGAERADYLRQIGLPGAVADAAVFVFDLREASKEVRVKDGDFLFSFLPEDLLALTMHDTIAGLKRRFPALERRRPIENWDYTRPARADLKVSVKKLDRAARRLVIEAPTLLVDLVELDIADFGFDAARARFGILDPVVIDFFTRRLREALSGRPGSQGIRNPPLAAARPLFPAAIANVAALNPRRTAGVPAETFIWNADIASRSATGLDADAVLRVARQRNLGITPRQVDAIERAVQRHLAIWWGPPGTGKSATAQGFLAGSLASAAEEGTGLRIAITAVTWVAIDHVARKVPEILHQLGLEDRVLLARLVSRAEAAGQIAPELEPFMLAMDDRDAADRIELEAALAARDRLVVVASTVDQIAKLGRGVMEPMFDLMLIDEASQVDVAHAIVGFTKLAPDARVVVVGDDLQMAPIHPIEPPEGAGHLVGSIFDFYRNYRGEQLERTMLDRSFRSNREIIDFVKLAGYPDLHASDLTAGLRFATARPIPARRPATWPGELEFSPALPDILDPGQPLAAVVHNDRYSSQRNQEEADLVAGMVLALFDAGLMDIDDDNRTALSPVDFFRKGVGIVTPHRAQQAAVFERLSAALAGRVDENEIFAAVDTVERFQGQEKTVMIASFGLGDKDQIAAEETFLFNLNRFNVTASRAKAKFVAIMSRKLVDHLPSDKEALIQSRLLKHFVDGFLRRSEQISVPGFTECHLHGR
ncbi:bifunctional RecB family nuclease/DEAD/DEAH box helicase [Bradyrhizobium iriomotense]|uniref:bifunctional RecB family nuclease/DEAD/DEAH box helicase n=1 Tax=Bradyrhizobium iriomotense TaxID=441950 RepID=UPI001B8A8386|nr:AAA domain-containing protein [Bradyrhizobium iriomotense]MBR0780746.1 ATP-binding protein [Bradyrhizobium iriomotense]